MFVSTMQGGAGSQGDVFTVSVDGTGEPALLYDHPTDIVSAEVSRSRDWLVMQLESQDIMALRLGVDEEARPLLANPDYAEVVPRLSPDGRWLAYNSNESGRWELNIRPFPNVGAARIPVSRAGGLVSSWSPDGDELFYTTPDRIMMAAQLSLGPSLEVASRQELFEISPDYVGFVSNGPPLAEVAHDGRFLMMRRAQGRAQFVLIQNWFEELKQRVPH